MSCSRSAMLMVAAFIMVGTPARSMPSSDAPVGRSIPVISGQAASSIDGILLSRDFRRSTFSPFTPWKSRLKIVLEETNEKIVAALEKAGIEFLDDGQGVRLKPAKTKRKSTK